MSARYRDKPNFISIAKPKMGSKGFLLDNWGVYVLEQGPGVLRGLACTHAGSGTLQIIDGIPNDDGFFPDESILSKGHLEPLYNQANGRPIFQSPGSVMGMWHLNIGLHHGLTVCAIGGNDTATPVVTLIWDPIHIIKSSN